MADDEDHLAQAQRHVEEGATRIADLKARLAGLELHGHTGAASVAKELLQTLEESRKLAIEHLRIERQSHPRT